jgi:GGDEF domain-containing protein
VEIAVPEVGGPARAAPAGRGRSTSSPVLAIGGDVRRLRVLRAFVDGLASFRCTGVGSVGPGLNALVGRPWSAAIVVDDLPTVGAEQVIATARAVGTPTPVVALVLGFDPRRSQRLYAAGAAEVVTVSCSPLAPLAHALRRVVERQRLLARVSELERSIDERRALDAETGAYPRWRFEEELRLEARRARRRRADLGLLAVDFRTSPPLDRLPPAERAVALRKAAQLVRNSLREGDVVAHDGDGRFRALLVDASAMTTDDRAQMVRRALRSAFDGAGLTALVSVEVLDGWAAAGGIEERAATRV